MARCFKHPKYDGEKKPKNECVECLELYLSTPRFRSPHRPTKSFRDKNTYSRREKHKRKLTDLGSDTDSN